MIDSLIMWLEPDTMAPKQNHRLQMMRPVQDVSVQFWDSLAPFLYHGR